MNEPKTTEYTLYGIEYEECRWDYNINPCDIVPTGRKCLYSATSTATLFDTVGKANARLKTHFTNCKYSRNAKVVKVTLFCTPLEEENA